MLVNADEVILASDRSGAGGNSVLLCLSLQVDFDQISNHSAKLVDDLVLPELLIADEQVVFRTSWV